jgi:hypothetical protein
MAYIQFLSEQLVTKEEIFLRIMLSSYNLENLDSIFFKKQSEEINLSKDYFDDGIRIEENITFLKQDIDTYIKYSQFSDNENPCVVLNAIEGKRLISLFSADKVRCKRLLFEFSKEYLKLHPDNYLLVDQLELYDLNRIENLPNLLF